MRLALVVTAWAARVHVEAEADDSPFTVAERVGSNSSFLEESAPAGTGHRWYNLLAPLLLLAQTPNGQGFTAAPHAALPAVQVGREGAIARATPVRLDITREPEDVTWFEPETRLEIQTKRVAPVTRLHDQLSELGQLPEDLPVFSAKGGRRKPPPGKGPSEFDLNRGRAVDILRADYPEVFTRAPDLSIFTETMEFHAMGEKRLSGVRQYERVFNALRFLRRTTMKKAEMTYRVVLQDDGTIKVRWSSKLKMRDPITGLTAGKGEADLYIDGVSLYDLDEEGKIWKHSLENVEMLGGDPPVRVSQLVFALPGGGGAGIQLIPNFAPGRAFLSVLEAATPAGLGALFLDGPPVPEV